MWKTDLEAVVTEVVSLLARGERDLLFARCPNSRVSPEDLRRVMQQYGRTFVVPPASAYRPLDAVRVTGVEPPTWSVDAPLWTLEEGESDLTLRLTITRGSGALQVQIDDLLVP